MKHDHELTRAIQERFLAPRIQIGRIVFERAQRRGEIDPDVDIELLFDVLPGMVMNRRLVLGKPVDEDFIATSSTTWCCPPPAGPPLQFPPTRQIERELGCLVTQRPPNRPLPNRLRPRQSTITATAT
jgi:hypothetical protein